MPSSVLLMIASSDDATIAASSDCASILLVEREVGGRELLWRPRACAARAASHAPSTMIGTTASM